MTPAASAPPSAIEPTALRASAGDEVQQMPGGALASLSIVVASLSIVRGERHFRFQRARKPGRDPLNSNEAKDLIPGYPLSSNVAEK